MQFIPNNSEEVVRRTEAFYHSEAPIKHVVDDVLLLYMECIYELFQEKMRETTNFSQNQNFFQDLQNDVRFLIYFAGQIQRKLNSADTMRRLTDFQNRMSYDRK